MFPSASAKKYESKLSKVKNEETQLNAMNRSLKKLSVTSVFFGICIIAWSLFQHMFFSGGKEFISVLKEILWENGFWSMIVGLQILTFAFCSNFFQNLAYLLLNFSNRHKENWNVLCTGILLTNIVTFGALSSLSFYGIISYIITPSTIIKAQMSVSSIFSFSLNLIFIALQFFYIFLKVCQNKHIRIEPYFPPILPGFAVMLEVIGNNLKDFLAQKLLLHKKLKKKHSTEMHDAFKKEEDILFSVE